MSFWLSAIPVQNCSLNLKLSFLKKARDVKVSPTVQTNTGGNDNPHAPLNSSLGIVATGREVVQEDSHTHREMTRCVRLFNNTLSPCGNLTHGETVVSGDGLVMHQRIRFSNSAASNFHWLPGN
jgi:hypothetical protein